jgi:hypothetical protein
MITSGSTARTVARFQNWPRENSVSEAVDERW